MSPSIQGAFAAASLELAFFFEPRRVTERDADMRTPSAREASAWGHTANAGGETWRRRDVRRRRAESELLCEPAAGVRLRRHGIEGTGHRRWFAERAERQPFAIQLLLERREDRLANADTGELRLQDLDARAAKGPPAGTRDRAEPGLEILVVQHAARERRERVEVARGGRRALCGEPIDRIARPCRGMHDLARWHAVVARLSLGERQDGRDGRRIADADRHHEQRSAHRTMASVHVAHH